ncbi:YkuS family protein [Anaerophilus nitritogenes]|uniref:YkuS family protein n=1 Tax=Anaerophilus nitritogenes TaxID=2498136 RepID=UPI00101E07BC|nr:YkuS family protein [Anaerophilus nitritogenes]
MKKVAVEKSLKNIKSYLSIQGYEVRDLESSRKNLKNFDAIIVSGQNSNILGMQDTNTKTSVINVSGMTPEDVATQLNNTLS